MILTDEQKDQFLALSAIHGVAATIAAILDGIPSEKEVSRAAELAKTVFGADAKKSLLKTVKVLGDTKKKLEEVL